MHLHVSNSNNLWLCSGSISVFELWFAPKASVALIDKHYFLEDRERLTTGCDLLFFL